MTKNQSLPKKITMLLVVMLFTVGLGISIAHAQKESQEESLKNKTSYVSALKQISSDLDFQVLTQEGLSKDERKQDVLYLSNEMDDILADIEQDVAFERLTDEDYRTVQSLFGKIEKKFP